MQSGGVEFHAGILAGCAVNGDFSVAYEDAAQLARAKALGVEDAFELHARILSLDIGQMPLHFLRAAVVTAQMICLKQVMLQLSLQGCKPFWRSKFKPKRVMDKDQLCT
jgi:hypothetical protein